MSVEVKIIPINSTFRSGKAEILTNQTTLNVTRTAYDLQELSQNNDNFKISEVYISEYLDPTQEREDMYGNRYKQVAPSILLEWFSKAEEPLCESDRAIMAYLATITCEYILFFD